MNAHLLLGGGTRELKSLKSAKFLLVSDFLKSI